MLLLITGFVDFDGMINYAIRNPDQKPLSDYSLFPLCLLVKENDDEFVIDVIPDEVVKKVFLKEAKQPRKKRKKREDGWNGE